MSEEQNKPGVHIGGGVSGTNVNFGTQSVQGDFIINTGKLTQAGDDTRAEIAKLIADLQAAIQKEPAEKQEDAEVVASLAQEAATLAADPQPKRKMLEIKGENLVKAAQNLLAVAPIAVEIAKKLLLLG